MRDFESLTAMAVRLPGDNVDTDQIFPARYMSRPRNAGFADYLLRDHRFDVDGLEKPDFVLNKEPFRRAQILIAGENFACGSAREHAVAALLDYGFRVVIAASMGDIFASSALENGLLAMTLPPEDLAALEASSAAHPHLGVTVELETQRILPPQGPPIPFRISRRRKEALLSGLDPLSQTMQSVPDILAFEARHQPWTPAISVA
jgi:3-isopropylmalate/(R)-2-methylmalate dehydratase small subunit